MKEIFKRLGSMFTEQAKRVKLKLRINKSTSGTIFNREILFVSKHQITAWLGTILVLPHPQSGQNLLQ